MLRPRQASTLTEPEPARGLQREKRRPCKHGQAISGPSICPQRAGAGVITRTLWGHRLRQQGGRCQRGSLLCSIQSVCRACRLACAGRVFGLRARRQALANSVVVQPQVAPASIERKQVVLQAAPWQPGWRCARPNPSVKRSANGVPLGPGSRYGVHFLQPGPSGTPLAPAYLER